MKIMVTAIAYGQLAGVLNYVEVLIHGLKSLGHDVDFNVVPILKTEKTRKNFSRADRTNRTVGVGTGLYSDFPNTWQGATLLRTHKKEDVERLNDYDLVIHSMLAVPKKYKIGVMNLFEGHSTPQIGVAHDPSTKHSISYLSHYQDLFRTLICVHEGTYESCKGTGIPIAFIPNPHIINPDKFGMAIEDRPLYLFSGHHWRTKYKNLHKVVDTMIRASRSLGAMCAVSGDGIEMSYFCSEDKQYDYMMYEFDTMYRVAKDEGIDFMKFISNPKQFEMMQNCKFFLDFDYRARTAEYGCLFNRTLVEAMMAGCIPIVVRESLEGSSYFNEDEHYLAVSKDDMVQDAMRAITKAYYNPSEIIRMQCNNWSVVNQFDHRRIAERIIDAVKGQGVTRYPMDEQYFENGARKIEAVS